MTTHTDLVKANSEVVAFLIDDYITNDLIGVVQLIKHCNRFEYITRARASMMAAFDLGKQWEDLASAPVLFGLDENKNPVFTEGCLLKPKEAQR